ERTVTCLVDVSRLPELKGIHRQDDVIRIGAAVTHQRLAASKLLQEQAAALAQGAAAVGSPQIRYMGTVGGNVVNAQPAADTAIPLLALGAEAEIAGLEGTRREPLEALYVRPGESRVDGSCEILVALRFPALGSHGGSAFGRLAKRRALALPILNAAVVVRMQGDGRMVKDVGLALGPVALTPFRARQAEAALRGQPVEQATVEAALEIASQEAQPRSNPLRGSAEYRREMVKVLLTRALQRALEAAQA
ncbi:MAG: FAD binding domain-containing protein, partial [Anaerolineae bacterium]|nr:FAD binding domain-containing protein [Anaerolineae bacterium]